LNEQTLARERIIVNKHQTSFVTAFFRLESAGGILLIGAAVLAMVCANTPLQSYYNLIFDTRVAVQVGEFEIAKPLLLWVNDGLMAVFFFLIGLELKRELMEGQLADRRNMVLPAAGALGGMLVPALIYIGFNADDNSALQGWAIPAATDIAFALGVLSLLGRGVPLALKLFLTTLAIIDDIGAIIIIAVFYTEHISLTALLVVLCCLPLLALLNRRNVAAKSLYVLIGLVMWSATLKSGVHATLAGVLLALFIPLQTGSGTGNSPLKEMENDLHALVAFFILPLFAFANTGISFTGVGIAHLLHPVPLGIAMGLFVGKQAGVFGCCWLLIKLRLVGLPTGVNWRMLYGAAVLCGIGFTMSLFIGSLAFEETGVNRMFDERLGIIVGSLLSGVLGYLLLRMTLVTAATDSPARRVPDSR